MTQSLLVVLLCLVACSKTSVGFQSRMPSRFVSRKTVQGIVPGRSSPSPTSLNLGVDMASMTNLLLADEGGYSNLSLYGTLALYVLTLPGLFSLVTRSVKVKLVQKNFDLPGPGISDSKPVKLVAAEVMAYFKALNYEVSAAEDVITFKGVMGRSNSQAYFLTFCTFIGLASLALVVSTVLPAVGSYPYAAVLLSPYAGFYYWNNAQREDVVKVRMETADDEQTIGITAEGGKEDLERFAKALELPERGMVYVKGFFESSEPKAAKVTTTATASATAQVKYDMAELNNEQ